MCATFPTSATNTAQHSPSILCVDDSDEMLLICRTVLEAAGYQVFTASGGGGALEFLQSHPVNAVVLDYVMPGMSGPELAIRIKRMSADVLVVMFSGSLRGDETFPFVDSCLPKGKGPLALRKLLGLLLHQ